jgi:hypothetical protein
VIREQRADTPEWHRAVVATVTPRQKETTEARESRMRQHVVDAVVEA